MRCRHTSIIATVDVIVVTNVIVIVTVAAAAATISIRGYRLSL